MSTKPNTNQITYDTGSNKQDLNNILDTVIPVADYTALRNYTGRATQVRITADGIAGFFKYDSTETTSTDNGGTIIVAGTKRWKRVFDGVVNVKWFGALGNGVTDDTAAFTAAGSSAPNVEVVVPRGVYLLSSAPAPTGNVTWVIQKWAMFIGAGKLSYVASKIVSRGAFRSTESDPAYYDGALGYLEQNAAESAYGTIGYHGSAQSSGGGGGSSEADIGVAGSAINNLAGGSGGVWALYGTAVRESNANGATHALELNIANTGDTTVVFPSQLGGAGLSNALWLASGGEVTNTPGAAKTASCAIGIISNDPAGLANFEKGIVFQNRSVAGTDGGTGSGCAIAFAAGHSTIWFNNMNQPVGEVTCSNRDSSTQQRIDFNPAGILFQERTTGRVNFKVENNALGVNHLTTTSEASTGAPKLKAEGADANIDLFAQPKGSGVFGVTYGSSVAAAPGGFIASRYLPIKDGNNVVWYVPLSNSPW